MGDVNVIELRFKPAKDTPNTILFQEEKTDTRWSEPKGVAIGPLYIQSEALGKIVEDPLRIEELKVTIEVSKKLDTPRAKMGK